MDKKKAFDEDETNYDKYRPKYCLELFSNILEYAKIDSNSKVVEVGCGTGQATEPFLKIGSKIIAIELGEKLATFTSNKFKDYDNFQIQNIPFEEFQCESNSINLVYSATAFHWIPDEIGYSKVYDMLRSGGTIALFWNIPAIEQGELYDEIQMIYNQVNGVEKKSNSKETKGNNYRITEALLEKYGFISFEFHTYKQTRVLSAEDYISLLNTYSDHITMEAKKKNELYHGIKKAINKHGGKIHILDTIDLYIARKP